MQDAIKSIERIEQDFAEGNGPFSDVKFPEERLLEELKIQAGDTDEPIHFNMEERARILAIFCTFDYNRNASRLVDNLVELHERDANLLDPLYVNSKNELEAHFDSIGFRYPNRDAHGWAKNCEILRNRYNGRVTELILSTGCDAPTFVEQLNKDDFLYLKGKKIAPMYARFIDQYIAPMDGMWELDIPADTHIIRLTEELCNAEMDADDVRACWRAIGTNEDIQRHVVDGGMWQVGNNWESWGKEYWNEVMEE